MSEDFKDNVIVKVSRSAVEDNKLEGVSRVCVVVCVSPLCTALVDEDCYITIVVGFCDWLNSNCCECEDC